MACSDHPRCYFRCRVYGQILSLIAPILKVSKGTGRAYPFLASLVLLWIGRRTGGLRSEKSDFLPGCRARKIPDKGFVGNPNDAWGNVPPASYGVHAQPVADLLQEYGLQAEARRDMNWEDLQREIAAGRPGDRMDHWGDVGRKSGEDIPPRMGTRRSLRHTSTP